MWNAGNLTSILIARLNAHLLGLAFKRSMKRSMSTHKA